jgi:hypothetical protein
MKDGYIQLKIAEINDKCKNIEQLIKVEKSKIELLEERVGGFKDLIKKLKDIDHFKQNLLTEIKKDNKKLLREDIQKISKEIADNIEKLLIEKIKGIDKKLDYILSIETKIEKQNDVFLHLNENINYLLKHNDFLMMKLVNKAVISDREVNEMHIRSSKKR